MDVNEFLSKMSEIQNILIDYLDEQANNDEKFNDLKKFNFLKILGDKHLMTSTIYLLSSIIYYHQRDTNFYDKIFNIILFFKDEFKTHFTNYEIFNFFKNNKRVILFLSEKKIINFDWLILSKLSYSDKQYFKPELKEILSEESINFTENFKETRKIEYYDNHIIQLIQNDLIDEFIKYINQTDINLDDRIDSSLFETNFYLSKNNKIFKSKVKLIDYSAFFGSIQIFKYLISQKVIIKPEIWIFAIHGRNPEIIHIIEDMNITPNDEMLYKKCLKMSIQCHHNDLTNYLLNNYALKEDYSTFILKQSLKYYNFSFIQNDLIKIDVFYDLCKNGYFYLANSILKANKSIDINTKKHKEKLIGDELIIKEKNVLFASIEKGHFEIVKFLLEFKNIDVNLMSFIGKDELTPLYAAINHGNIKIVQSLLNNKNIDINMKSIIGKEKQTPLYTAINKEYFDIIQLLIERNDININLKSLHFDFGLLENDSDSSYDFYKDITALYKSVECKNSEIVKLLVEHKNIDVNIKSSIKFYSDYDDLNDPNFMEDTVLYHAVIQKNINAVRLLLSNKKIDVNIKTIITYSSEYKLEKTILIAAVENNLAEIVKLLLEFKNININEKLKFPLIKSQVDIWDEKETKSFKMKIINDMKESPHFSGYSNNITEKTALYIAVENKNVDIVKLLLDNENIDPNIKSFNKLYVYVCDKLITEKEEKELNEMTPLYLAVENNNLQIVELLVDHIKININMKSTHYLWRYEGPMNNVKKKTLRKKIIVEDKEETALHNAVSKDSPLIVKYILGNKNTDINVIDKQGMKPIDLAPNSFIKSLFKLQDYADWFKHFIK